MITVLIASFVILLSFYLLAVISEDYFVPAIDKLSNKLGLSSDAAGATLLAMGSSAPEFFTSLFAVFGTGNNSDIGAGAIVGSAIFNVLVIVGAAAAYKAVTLQWQPVIRDMVFYIISILLLLFAFSDGKVTLLEAGAFTTMYLVYVFAVVRWRRWFKYEDINAVEMLKDNKVGRLGTATRAALDKILISPHKRPHMYLLTFLLSIGSIALLSSFLVRGVEEIAHVLDINATFLALTVLAAGTSIPDLIGSVVVAKQGRGDMAVSNAIGSNIFDILFGLGMPWMLVILFRGDDVAVSSNNLTSSVVLLFATVIALLFLMTSRNWKLGNKSGYVLIGLYGVYLVYVTFTVLL